MHVWHLQDVRSKLRLFTTLAYFVIPLRSWLLFYPDTIAGVLVEDLSRGPTRYVALVEMKSRCSLATLTQQSKLIAEFGEYQEINAEEDPELFKRSIPDASYRCQLLYGTASGALDHALYVVASLRKIIRVLHV